MANSDNWTGRWVATKIEHHEDVESVEVVDSKIILVTRKNKPSVKVATLAKNDPVTAKLLNEAVGNQRGVKFIVNVPKDSYFTGDAIKFTEFNKVGIGGLGDLMRALRLDNVEEYVHPTIAFIEQGLRQHDSVRSFERLADLSYQIYRTDGLVDVAAVFLHEYELTADHIRVARDRYGKFEIVVITDPNGSITASAIAVAGDLGCRIYKWGDFLGALNRR